MTTDFATCDFCDTHKNDTDGSFRVLPPVFRDYGKRLKFSGRVTTVKCFEDNSLVKEQVELEGRGKVLVVDGGGSLRRALLGDMLAEKAAKNGWEGLVIYGCIRDVDVIAQTDLGVQAQASHPMKTDKRGRFANRFLTSGQYVLDVKDKDKYFIKSANVQVKDAGGVLVELDHARPRAAREDRPPGQARLA